MAKRNAAGNGTIRKKTVKRNGKDYVFWEARYTVGTDPGTGKQIQRSISGKTQKEVAQKLKAATSAIDAGTYIAPSKMTVGEWLDIWQRDYLCGVKPFTVASYSGVIRNHIKPALGAIRLEDIHLDDLYMVGGIKSAAGKGRCLAFPAFLRPVVEQMMEHGTRGKLLAINEQKFYEEYYAALDRAGIVRTENRQMTPHCCRHTFISLATDSGIPIATVQKMAGHSDISVTAGYYHSHDPLLIQAAQKIPAPVISNTDSNSPEKG